MDVTWLVGEVDRRRSELRGALARLRSPECPGTRRGKEVRRSAVKRELGVLALVRALLVAAGGVELDGEAEAAFERLVSPGRKGRERPLRRNWE